MRKPIRPRVLAMAVVVCSGCGMFGLGWPACDAEEEQKEEDYEAEFRQRMEAIFGPDVELDIDVEERRGMAFFVPRFRPSDRPLPTFEELRCPEGMVKIPGREDPPLAPFCMSETLVTAKQYEACVAAQWCSEPALNDYAQSEKFATYGNPSRANFPVNYVTHEQAAAYCAFIGGVVPNEEEWLWAYGSARDLRFPWGNDIPHDLEVCRGPDKGNLMPPPACPAGAHPHDRTTQGVYDMAGSLDELVRIADSALPRKAILKPCPTSDPAYLAADVPEDTKESWLRLEDVREADGTAKGLSGTYVYDGASGSGFRCLARPRAADVTGEP